MPSPTSAGCQVLGQSYTMMEPTTATSYHCIIVAASSVSMSPCPDVTQLQWNECPPTTLYHILLHGPTMRPWTLCVSQGILIFSLPFLHVSQAQVQSGYRCYRSVMWTAQKISSNWGTVIEPNFIAWLLSPIMTLFAFVFVKIALRLYPKGPLARPLHISLNLVRYVKMPRPAQFKFKLRRSLPMCKWHHGSRIDKSLCLSKWLSNYFFQFCKLVNFTTFSYILVAAHSFCTNPLHN